MTWHERLARFGGPLSAERSPLLPFAAGVCDAEAASDPTGTTKRLFELGAALPRYACGVGLALLSQSTGGAPAPADLASELRKAARLSDGAWFALARKVGAALHATSPAAAKLFAFARSQEATRLVEARNEFIHYGKAGTEAPALLEALLERAAPLLGAGISADGDGLAVDVDGRVVALDPWLPLVEGAHAMIDAPSAGGGPWRAWIVKNGEHREARALDQAVRALSGGDGDRPVPPTSRPALVGHEAAVATLTAFAREAAAGAVRIGILRGPVGIGRSRLTATLAESAAAFGFAAVLESACSPHRRAAFSALSRALDGAESEALDEVLDAVDRAKKPLVAESPASLAAALEAVEDALLAASRATPVLWVVDDAQWIDERSLDLVQLLADRAGRRSRGKLMVVLSMRLGGTGYSLEKLLAHPSVVEKNGAALVRLEPLEDAAAKRLVDNVAPLAPEVAAKVVREASGVPHYLVQPVLGWHEAGALSWKAGKWSAEKGVLEKPVPGARELVAARIASFFEEDAAAAAESLLSLVAQPGGFVRESRILRAAKAAAIDEALAARVLGVLVEARILEARTGGAERSYGFCQALVRDAVLAGEARPDAARLARALLDTIAAEPAARAEAVFLGRGYARLGETDLAKRWLREAAEAAMDQGAFALAAELSHELAPLAGGAAERYEAQLLRADALQRAGLSKEAREALATLDAREAAAAALLRARIVDARLRDLSRERDEAKDLALVADADAGATHDAALRVDARIAVARLVGGARGLALADEAIALAEDPRRRYRALVVRTAVAFAEPRRDLARLRQDLAAARAIAEDAGASFMVIEAEMDLAALEVEGDTAGALARYRELAGRAAKAGLSRLARLALVNVTALELRTSAFAAAQAHAREAIERGAEVGDSAVVAAANGLLADALLRGKGDLEEAQRAAEEAVRIKRAAKDRTLSLAVLRSAQVAAARGDRAGALEAARAALAAAEATPYLDMAEQAALWLALERAKQADAGAEDALCEALARVDALGASARAPTLALAKEARAFIGSGDDKPRPAS